MIQSSAIITKRVLSSLPKIDPTLEYTISGCSEYVSHASEIIETVSLGFFGLEGRGSFSFISRDLSPWLNGFDKTKTKENSIKILNLWTEFVASIFEPISERAGVPIVSVMTADDLMEYINAHKTHNAEPVIELLKAKGVDYFYFAQHDLHISDLSGNIALRVDANYIRKIAHKKHLSLSKPKEWMLEGKVQSTKKVQMAHTIYRLLWSNGNGIAGIALYLWLRGVNLDPLQILWMAYALRSNFDKSGSSYGDTFSTNDPEYIPTSEFIENFFNNDMNLVMEHFYPKKDADIESIIGDKRLNAKGILFKALDIKGGTPATLDATLKKLEKIPNKVFEDTMSEIHSNHCIKLDSASFEFKSKIYNSIVVGEKYDGYFVPESRLKRMIFKDEDNCWLSVISTGNSIKILTD